MIDALIQTKLRLPFIRPGLVTRPRLHQQIERGLHLPLTMIAAPAGFGKTTLVVSGIKNCGMAIAWLSLDKHDNQPGRFLTYLIAAMQAADTRIGAEAAQMVTGIQQARPEAVLTSLINDLDCINRGIALVLDDYHLISSQAVHEELTFLLNHQPACLHIIIATRSDPPLPLARLRARGQLIELRAAELRFTEKEASQFLNETMGLDLDEKSVSLLDTRTEGWIAGLQMAALSMKDRQDITGFIQGFTGTNRYILDYLLEEVLNRQSSDIQDFLLQTSILERMSASLCDALLSDAPFARSSAEILATLERENLFLIALEDSTQGGIGGSWFRFHHLFSDLLRARLQQSKPGLLPRLHVRASAWFEQNGLIAEAIYHLVAAQKIDRAADMMEQYGPTHWLVNDPSIIQLAEGLPHEFLLARPKLSLYLAWLLICQAHIEKAIPLLNDLTHILTNEASRSEFGWMQTMILSANAFLYPSGKPNEISGMRQRPELPDDSALAEIPESEPILRDATEVMYGMALARRGDLDGAVKVSLRCIREASQRAKTEHTATVPSQVPFLARVYVIQGRLHAAVALCHEYLKSHQTWGTRAMSSPGSMEITIGEALYEWNQLEEAEKYLRDGLRANKPWENIMTYGFGTTALMHVLQAKGDIPAALEVFKEFKARMLSTDHPSEFKEVLQTMGIRLQLAAGDLQNASLWADQIQHNHDFQRHPERYQLTLANIRLAQGRYLDVEEILRIAPPLETAPNQIVRQIETHLLLAVAADRQHQTQKAHEYITTCLSLAEPEGYLRVFLNMGNTIRELIATYFQLDTSAHKPFARKILEAFAQVHPYDSQDIQRQALVEGLTNRELEVLQLMAVGKTNPQIAQQLIVAPGTIKAHAASIYRKLDATNRTEAVARARQLGLLP
jgi:LuxR family maltose regulon positive regulatory protein